MMRRILGSAVLAMVAALVVQPSADAAPMAQLELASVTVDVDPGNSGTPGCDASQPGACGYLTIESVFRGLENLPRPADTLYNAGDLTGTIKVIRTYGCRDAGGKRLHRLDRTVVTSERLTNYRGGPVAIPASGDTITKYSYVFLGDRLPADCPSGTTAALYKMRTGRATLSLEFFVDGYPNGWYTARTHSMWKARS